MHCLAQIIMETDSLKSQRISLVDLLVALLLAKVAIPASQQRKLQLVLFADAESADFCKSLKIGTKQNLSEGRTRSRPRGRSPPRLQGRWLPHQGALSQGSPVRRHCRVSIDSVESPIHTASCKVGSRRKDVQ